MLVEEQLIKREKQEIQLLFLVLTCHIIRLLITHW